MLKKERLLGVRLITFLHVCFLSICIATEKNQSCRPSSCGNIANISDPFRLKGDPSGCGDPLYELACENNHTVINLNHNKYYVAQINYHNYTIRVLNPGIQKGNCFSTPLYSLSSRELGYGDDPYEWPYEWGIKTTVLLNCSSRVSDQNLIPITHCNSSGNHTYSYAQVGDIKLRDVPYSCSIGKTLFYQPPAVSQPRNRSMSDLQDELLKGVELSFLLYRCSRECHDLPGRYCHLNHTHNTLQCEIVSSVCDNPFYCMKPICKLEFQDDRKCVLSLSYFLTFQTG